MLLLLACTTPAAPPAPSTWTLLGRVEPGRLLLPAHPAGFSVLPDACSAPDPPPCFAERWTDGRRELEVIRAGELHIDGGRGRVSWSALGPGFLACVGDPLAHPPAGEAGATRDFDGTSWRIHYRGQNRCRIEGELRLHATRDDADWHALRVDGLPWDAGGREKLGLGGG